MTITLNCSGCGHDDTEHTTDGWGNPKEVTACTHDNYYDDGGERIHDFCKCKKFTWQTITQESQS